MQPRYYFDSNATTPLSPEVYQAMAAALEDEYGNASSIHHFGQSAKQALEGARREVAALIGAGHKEIVFTSGGTEADNLALFGVLKAGDHLVTTAIEHPAVLNAARRLEAVGVAVTYVRPPADGVVEVGQIEVALRPNTRLVSVMHANNETGVIQPVEEIAGICRAAGVLFHSDGVQAAGKIAVDVKAAGIDLYSISAHKIRGPKGIGALYVKPGLEIQPQMHGGRHEGGRRAGTENVPGAIGFGVAARYAGPATMRNIKVLRDRLEYELRRAVPDIAINGEGAARMPNTSSVRFRGIQGEAMVIALDLKGFAVSSGSACSSGAVEPSHVLLAMGQTADEARSSVRFSLSSANTGDDVELLIRAVAECAARLRRISATYSHA